MKVKDKKAGDGKGGAEKPASNENADEKSPVCAENQKQELSDEDYWEEMLLISRGPAGWNIGCGCG